MRNINLGGEHFVNYGNLEDGKFHTKEGGILIITKNIGTVHNYIKIGSFETLENIKISELRKDEKELNFCILIIENKDKRKKMFNKIIKSINKEKIIILKENIICIK
ncbi:hypothetical protein [Formosa algae]|uniref:hypothetical protein n=1 Tax=Formosa algae TaxID=225843 RepID=UPI000CCF06F3|nr:hypothetical protein [Formosa algae]PNW25267.1 hypothetical protein BKP44_19760 [Formosa algae]